MKNRETERTVVTLGNGVDLVAQIAKKVVGEEVADMYDGAPLSNEVMHRLERELDLEDERLEI